MKDSFVSHSTKNFVTISPPFDSGWRHFADNDVCDIDSTRTMSGAEGFCTAGANAPGTEPVATLVPAALVTSTATEYSVPVIRPPRVYAYVETSGRADTSTEP